MVFCVIYAEKQKKNLGETIAWLYIHHFRFESLQCLQLCSLVDWTPVFRSNKVDSIVKGPGLFVRHFFGGNKVTSNVTSNVTNYV